jgi:hypothetical protein
MTLQTILDWTIITVLSLIGAALLVGSVLLIGFVVSILLLPYQP